MADEPENPEHPALVMLLQLEARLNGLADELLAVRSRLAYVEGRLAQVQSRLESLEAERDALLAPDARMQDAIEHALHVTAVAPPLLPGEDEDALADLVRQIMERRTYVHVLSDEERAALEEAWRHGVISRDEMTAFWKSRGIE
jgi:chromosome segregation ATPase